MRQRPRIPCHVLLVGFYALTAPGRAAAQAPPLGGGLMPGPHAVGFTPAWQLDHARRVNTTFDDKTTYAPGKAPRPILVNMWYPAARAGDGKPMPHRGYLDISSN